MQISSFTDYEMIKLLGIFFYLIVAACGWAESNLPPHFNIHDKASLQRGAALFMNYCAGCHSLAYLRYNQMAKGLGITNDALLKNNLIFTKASSVDAIHIALPADHAKQWFGMVPPDLSLVARQRGASWLFDYLMGFYTDKKRPFGVNNILVPDVAMPDVLEPLRGLVKLDRHNYQSLLKNIQPGQLAPAEFRNVIIDIVNFLVFVGEPTKSERYNLGPYVLLFLFLLLIPVYALKRMYWK